MNYENFDNYDNFVNKILLGKYKAERLLGEGSFGKIYEGK